MLGFDDKNPLPMAVAIYLTICLLALWTRPQFIFGNCSIDERGQICDTNMLTMFIFFTIMAILVYAIVTASIAK